MEIRLWADRGGDIPEEAGGVGGSFAVEGADAGPDKLKSGADGDHRDSSFQFSRGEFWGEKAAEDDTGNSAEQELCQDGRADGAEGPMDSAADEGQDEAEEKIGADDLRGRHFRIVEKQHGSESTGACGRKSRLQTDGEGKPRQPVRIPAREAGDLSPWNESDAGCKSQKYTERDDDSRIAGLVCENFESEHAKHKTRDRAQYQETKIVGMNLFG